MNNYLGLEGLEYSREVVVNGRRIGTDSIEGDISIDNDQGRTSTASFSVKVDPKNPIIRNPSRDTKSMIGHTVEVLAGYLRGPKAIMFRGRITEVGVSFSSSGSPIVSISAMSYSYLMSTVSRKETYPVVKSLGTPTKDSKGVISRVSNKSDDRSWAQRSTGSSITLDEIIKGIVSSYEGITVGQIKVPNISFNGLTRELHQEDISDWNFLQELAYEFNCNLYLEPETSRFYFVENSANSDGVTIVTATNESSGIKFYHHKYIEYTPRVMIDPEKTDPVKSSTELPMFDTSYSFSAPNVMGGFINQSVDIFGRTVLTAEAVNDKGEIVYERLVLDESKLDSPEAKEYFEESIQRKMSWEETKKFWKNASLTVEDYSASRENPPVYDYEPNLTFSTYANMYMRPMRKYQVHNLGFGEENNGDDYISAKCIGITYKLGETFMMEVKMIVY